MSFDWREDGRTLAWIVGVFAAFFFIPFDHPRVAGAVQESVALAAWYAREHVVLCLVPAFFIAGAIGVFVSQAAVMKYLGAEAKRWVAYTVAAVSGTILAVCSCTVLPLFGGIYKRGAGLGPASAFLYSGPAINVLAIVMTARVLGWKLGLARATGAVLFAVIIGLLMAFIFRKEERERQAAAMVMPEEEPKRKLWQEVLFFAAMVGVLVFANWGSPGEGAGAAWLAIHAWKWLIASSFGLALAAVLVAWFEVRWWQALLAVVPTGALALLLPSHPIVPFAFAAIALAVITATGPADNRDWFDASWGFARQIMPLLFGGVLVAGLLLGRVGHEGLIPREWVVWAVGGNSVFSNLFAAVAGAFMYFATLTEIPILEGLMDGGNGMGPGPALALLLAGPALSLPNMLVIGSILGWQKTATFVALVVVMATVSGLLYGTIVG